MNQWVLEEQFIEDVKNFLTDDVIFEIFDYAGFDVDREEFEKELKKERLRNETGFKKEENKK